MTHAEMTDEDTRAVIRLLGEMAALETGHAEKKRFLMESLCCLVHGDCWVWTLGHKCAPGEAQVYFDSMHGGFEASRFAHLLEVVAHPLMGAAVETFYTALAERQSQVTMFSYEVDPYGVACRDGVLELWEKANIGDLIISAFPLDEHSLSLIGICRQLDDAAFTIRDKKLAHMVLSVVPWLHASGWPKDRGVTVPKLSPRQRTVLNLLLDGMSRQQIAEHLRIASSTVAGYSKGVYRHFSVHSHAELMKKFRLGGENI